ncbi:hypothetical protein RRG08_039789 [Elysia crispata]|uniref:Uncharacterized protein n=1 Tax=Elysia crispata TaxID=231223 RepID=A0AAE1E3A8_9GAST|nr:hypothetical protein RRG08_039789 [Elysia crispata]
MTGSEEACFSCGRWLAKLVLVSSDSIKIVKTVGRVLVLQPPAWNERGDNGSLNLEMYPYRRLQSLTKESVVFDLRDVATALVSRAFLTSFYTETG